MKERTRLLLAHASAALLSLIFLIQGGVKLLAVDREVQIFQEEFHYPLWFMYLIGAVEVTLAILVWVPRLAGWACGAIFFLMCGALYTHVVRQAEPAAAVITIPPLILSISLGLLRGQQTVGLPDWVKRLLPRWEATGKTDAPKV